MVLECTKQHSLISHRWFLIFPWPVQKWEKEIAFKNTLTLKLLDIFKHNFIQYSASETADINCIINVSDTLPRLLKAELEATFPVERPYPQGPELCSTVWASSWWGHSQDTYQHLTASKRPKMSRSNILITTGFIKSDSVPEKGEVSSSSLACPVIYRYFVLYIASSG